MDDCIFYLHFYLIIKSYPSQNNILSPSITLSSHLTYYLRNSFRALCCSYIDNCNSYLAKKKKIREQILVWCEVCIAWLKGQSFANQISSFDHLFPRGEMPQKCHYMKGLPIIKWGDCSLSNSQTLWIPRIQGMSVWTCPFSLFAEEIVALPNLWKKEIRKTSPCDRKMVMSEKE